MPNIAVFIEQSGGTAKKVAWQMTAEARRLVVEAAFHPVLDRIPEAKYREEIEAYLTRRLLANG